jgi:HPt (histidine-containing phosphotransfer) domain-containing protein
MSEDLTAFPLMDHATIADLQKVLPETFRHLVTILLRDLPLQLADIQAAAAQGDADRLYRTAHKLKSGSGSMGALQLSELARHLEARGRSGNLAELEPLLEQIRLTVEQTRIGFETFLDT